MLYFLYLWMYFSSMKRSCTTSNGLKISTVHIYHYIHCSFVRGFKNFPWIYEGITEPSWTFWCSSDMLSEHDNYCLLRNTFISSICEHISAACKVVELFPTGWKYPQCPHHHIHSSLVTGLKILYCIHQSI